MELLIINAAQVRQLLPMHECIDAMEGVFRALGRGEALNPLRTVMSLPDKSGSLFSMPACTADAMGIKILSLMPNNHGTSYPSHIGLVLLFEAQHGQPVALMDAGEITALRTAAVSGVATRWLAKPDAGDLAILGAGVQARSHLAAMRVARNIQRVRVWSRTAEHARQFAAEVSQDIHIEVMNNPQTAVEGADIICAATAAPQPVVLGEWLSPGAHINAVGAHTPTTREVDTAAVVKSKFFADHREATLNEAGDFLIPRGEGAVTDAHIQAELADVVLGRHAGRTSPDEITLFKSLGLAVEDLGSAMHIYRKAVEQGVGVKVDL